MDPKRLLDSEEDRFEIRLLGAARDDAPPRGTLRRAEVALGFGVGAGAVATAAATSTAKAATTHIGAAHSVAAQVGVTTVLKWLGIGLVSGAVVTGGLSYRVNTPVPTFVARTTTTTNDVPSRNRGASRKAAPRRNAAAPEAKEPTELGEPAPLLAPSAAEEPATPGVEPGSVAAAPPPRASSPAPVAAITAQPDRGVHAPSLSTELEILERARHALLAQRPEVVLRELDSYARARNTGVFDAEAELLAIEAFLQQGNVGIAASRAARALERSPNGPHAARLREIVAMRAP